MELISVFLIALALSMDSFSVSVAKGFTQKNLKSSQIFYYGITFGLFHLFLPLLGFLAGKTITSFVSSFTPYIAFTLLLIIGINMIKEGITNESEEVLDEFSFKELFILAIATSIDAFAVGVSFALLNTNIIIAAIVTSIVVFLLSITGLLIGRKIGDFFDEKLMIIGGVVLILIGLKILLGL